MRTLSFENLRRLVGRRKDRDEPSFERSESFKRISIRKSYLDRGKRRTRLQKANDTSDTITAASVVTIEVSSRTRTKNIVGPTIIQVHGGDNVSEEFDLDEKNEKKITRDGVEIIGMNEVVEEEDDEDEKKVKRDTPAGTIVYGQWLNDVDSSYSSRDTKSRIDSYSSQDSKFNLDSSKEKIYISQENRPFTKRNIVLPPIQNLIDNDDNRRVSSVLIELDKSPHFPRSQSRILQRGEMENVQMIVNNKARNISNDCKSGSVTTVNVRSDIWKDSSFLAKNSKSLISLNQGIGINFDDKYKGRSAIAKTVSAPEKPVTIKKETNTRTSGFSLSLSFSRLTTDIRAAALTTKNGLFRRHKRTSPMKPAPSVSAEGYFERTAAAASSTRKSRRSSVGSGRRRATYASRRRKITMSKPGTILDTPVWFVPPERRRSNRQRGRVWREVRCLPQEDGKSDGDNVDSRSNDWSNDSNLSDEFDDKKLLLSGDFEEKSEEKQNPKKMDTGSTLDSSSLLSSAVSLASLKPKISDFNEDKIFYEEYRGEKSKDSSLTKSNFFASSQFLGFVAKSNAENVVHNSRYDCTSSSESEPDEQRRVLLVVGSNKKDAKDALNLNVTEAKTVNERRNCSVVLVVEGQRSCTASRQQEVGPGQRRRPLRRRSQLRRGPGIAGNNARGQPVYLARRRSSLRRRPCRDITQKGYEKKRTRLLQQYASKQLGGNNGNGGGGGGIIGLERTSFGSGSGSGGGGGGGGGVNVGVRPQPRARRTQRRVTHSEKRYHSGGRLVPSGIASPPGSGSSTSNKNNTGNSNLAATRRGNRRLTRNESRYHSEVRQEAVQQALAAMQSRPKPSLPMPSKRTSVMARSPERSERTNSGLTGHTGGAGESSSDEDSVVTEESPGAGGPSGTGLSDTSSTGSARDTPPPPRPPARRPPADITDIAEYTPHAYCNLVQPPDVTHTNTQSRRPAGADRVNRYHVVEENNTGTTGRWKVSAKIQQLLNTLKRPKRRPLPEFYEDDDIELEIAANPKDPNAPKPEGGTMTPAVGEQLSVPSGLPRSVEASIQRYGSASYKAPAATVLDPNGKLCVTLTYGKLLSRSYKIAYTLLNKALSRVVGECCLKPGDRIALVYPNDDPINFICAFYGCLQAGIVPVPIEVPLTRRDAGSQQIGFLLGSCGIQVALTSEACLKGLPKTTAGEVVAFKGWPKLHWFVTEHLGKTPKEWMPPTRLTDDTPAYIEYTTDRDGSVMGVTITRAAMLAHCRALTQACGYTEGENAVCVLDFKREVGLWHSTLTSILNGMHVIFIPYALMKVNPASWMQMITKHRASVAVVKSRDLHWGLLATKDHKDISLSTLRLLLVADGANPWSLSSCDQFLSVFQSKGLRPDAVCPCASSSEALTVSVRRPGRAGVNATGRGVLSMSGLSYGVVRVDQENSLTSLTLQDCGQVMPGSIVTVIKMEGPPLICKTDEVGEICVHSAATGSQYWGLQGLTNNNFKVSPLQAENQLLGDVEYARSGLLGFLGPGNLVFVCGSRDGLMTVTGRKHNADDIIATVLAVEPMKFIYRGRIAVFSVRVLRDERICVVAEQRPDCSEEESFQWMSRVLQAVDSIHAVGIYCLALVPPNYLPKTPLGGIHLSETKRRFLEGTLHPANVLLCPHTCVTNLPKPREIHSAGDYVPDVGPASVMVGNIVQGNRLASAQGRDMGVLDEDSDNAKKYQFISEILRWRAVGTSDHVIFTLLNSKGAVAASLSCSQLHKKAERIGNLLIDRARLNTGDHVALLFPPGTDLICAFYGCLYVGAVPVTIRPPHPQNLQTTLPTVRMIVNASESVIILTNQNIMKLLKSKEANNVVEVKSWPVIFDMDDMPKKRVPVFYRAPTAEMLAYLDFSVSTTGMLAGIKMSHAAVTSLCRAMKLACELYPSRHIALCLDPYSGLGFALWCLSSIYSGHHSILIPPSEVEANPALWLSAVSHSRVRDTFCSYGVMELCTKGLGSSVHALKARGVSLACVRTCVVVAEERPRIALTTSFSKLFSALGLSPRAVSTSFGCRVNTAICLQGASSPEPSTVYVDLRALRNDRVSLVERGSPHSLCLMESGKLLPGVKVIIANPETKGQCGDSHLGEIWVQSSHNASGYFSIYGDESDYADHFNARLVTGNTNEVYARTGYLGFLRRTENVQQSGGPGDVPGDNGSISEADVAPGDSELHDAVFVVGALDEAILLRGMRYHPIDIENSVMRCHKKIAECAVFTWTNLLVVVVELDGSESEALDLVALVTSAVLEEHHLVVGVVVVVDPGVVPINSRGEKQRMHLRDGFLADQLDPIYVAYNM
ncbi:PREDICTED: disco-interacting protein 2 homolog A [Ceratosolen solmsi marchali]|uniref:Disco-interacting protein 2 homolog A n=1 Tax=Ceratosolen solmsi marchali TaxID=326594 RepID=A0AAJ6YD23_9HYME|nr:PREDICTED: disco-interacting protein 2 homolog A [Ceratosolen solmsi marchali]